MMPMYGSEGTPSQACSPTRQMIVLSLRSRWEPDALRNAGELAKTHAVGWDEFEQIAHTEGVAPLLYAALHEQAVVPSGVEARLQQAFLTSRQQGMIMLAQLETILHRLDAAQIPALVLKGAALVETLYHHTALRPMSDVDLLLHRLDIPAALDLLAASGFARAHVDPHIGATLDYENEINLVHTKPPGGQVELHWSLFDSLYYQRHLDLAWFWQTARPIQVGRTPAHGLSAEAQLLHLCGHVWLHHHGQTKLLWQHDIALLLAQAAATIDWDEVLEQTQRCNLVLSLQGVLALMAPGWVLPVPAEVMTRIAGLLPTPAERQAVERIKAAQTSVGERFRADLTEIPDLWMRVNYVWMNLFPSVAYMRQRYRIRSPLLVWCYYPYRWGVGLRRLMLTRQRA